MRLRALAALAIADFAERTRRPAYLVTLAAAIVLGYLALPPASSRYVIMNAGGFRGVYNSAYTGTTTALAGSLWLMLGGFYVVRGAITRDERTRVGQILAATPLRSAGYLAGKFLSNLLVLASMAGALAVTALVIQLARGESMIVDPVALLSPFVLLTLPVLALTAAFAVLFETIPLLRAGLGNIAWFFGWVFAAIAGQGGPLTGLGPVAASMRLAMTAQHLPAASEFSLGFTKVDRPLATFTWPGLAPSTGFVIARLVLILAVAAIAILPAAWFDRFDTARAGRGHRSGPAIAPGPDLPASGQPAMAARTLAYRQLAPPSVSTTFAFGRMLVGEIRILVQGVSRWWWLAAAVLTAASLAVPADLVSPAGASIALLLSAVWFWPVLIWSRLGTQRRENGLDTLLASYPSTGRQLAAEWTAGWVLTAAVGTGPLLRMAIAADEPGVAAWLAGSLFIPSLALLAGTASRTSRTFQVGYLILWYAAVNQVSAADYMGTVLVHGRPAGPSPLFVAALATALFAGCLTIRAAQEAAR